MRFLITLASLFLVLSVTTFLIPTTRMSEHCAPLTPPPVEGTPTLPPVYQGTLLINEVLLHPHNHWICPQSDTSPPASENWVEVYNPHDQPLDLYAAHTTIDGGPDTRASYFPFASSIAPHGYLAIFLSLDRFNNPEGSTRLRLTISDQVVDDVSIPPLGPDQSYARIPDGSNTWQISDTPTIDASNSLSANSTPLPHSKEAHNNNDKPKNSGKGQKSTHTSSHDASLTSADGIQPNWGSLQQPESKTLPATQTTPSSSPNREAQIPLEQSVPQKILLTILSIIITSVLLAFIWLRDRFKRITSSLIHPKPQEH